MKWLVLIALWSVALSTAAQTGVITPIVVVATVEAIQTTPDISLFQAKYWSIWLVFILISGRLAWKKKIPLQNFYLLYKSYRAGTEYIPIQNPIEPEPTTGGFASGIQAYTKLTPKAKLPIAWIVFFVLIIGTGVLLYPFVIDYFHAVAQSNLASTQALPPAK